MKIGYIFTMCIALSLSGGVMATDELGIDPEEEVVETSGSVQNVDEVKKEKKSTKKKHKKAAKRHKKKQKHHRKSKKKRK